MTAPTPDEVRLAADVIQALSVSMDMPHPDVHWRPSELRAEAERIEAEILAAAERQSMTQTLRADLRALTIDTNLPHEERWDDCARQLIEAGWHKGDPA